MALQPSHPDNELEHPDSLTHTNSLSHLNATPQPSTLEVHFTWTKFRNIISTKSGTTLTPLYIQHFRPTKPHLHLTSATTNTPISTGTINHVSIAATCTVHGETLHLKPLKKWSTAYNYLSTRLGPSGTPSPITWRGNSNLKTWDFVCLDAAQRPVARFSANWWAVQHVGTFEFDAALDEQARDEVVTVGMTIFYVMAARMNNPFALFGAAFAKTERAEDGVGGVEMDATAGKRKVV